MDLCEEVQDGPGLTVPVEAGISGRITSDQFSPPIGEGNCT